MSAFVDIVKRRADVESDTEAEETAQAVLRTLSESISHGEAADLGNHLPEQFRRVLLDTERARAEPYSLDEFLGHVAERLDVSEAEAEKRSQAVVAALSDVAGVDEVEDAYAQLPPEYEAIVAPGEALGALSFVEAVEDRGDLDRTTARRASRAGLQVLGERVSKGEAENVAEHLPDEAAEWFVPDEPARALDYDFDELVAHVADEEGTSRVRAIEHLEAVTDLLAETVGESEFEQLQSQLPETYDPLFEE